MVENIVNLFRLHGIEYEKGLTFGEIIQIEKTYQLKMPSSLKHLLMTILPTSKGFYNWRNMQRDNIEYIKSVINAPFSYIDDMAHEVYWCDEWGEEPEDKEKVAEEVRNRLKNAPKLVPVYAHRYMPLVLNENPPVISIHGFDVIYYGENLEDYLNIEFGSKNMTNIQLSSVQYVPFWSDIM